MIIDVGTSKHRREEYKKVIELLLYGVFFSADLGDSSNYSVVKNWKSKQRKVSGEQCLTLS